MWKTSGAITEFASKIGTLVLRDEEYADMNRRVRRVMLVVGLDDAQSWRFPGEQLLVLGWWLI